MAEQEVEIIIAPQTRSPVYLRIRFDEDTQTIQDALNEVRIPAQVIIDDKPQQATIVGRVEMR